MILATLYIFLDLLLFALSGLILVRMILSWFMQPDGKVVQITTDLTEPVIAPIRKITPQLGVFDLAPLLTLLLIDVLRYFLFYL